MRKAFSRLLILCLLSGCSLFYPSEDPAKVQKEIIRYLENKYGQEFVVVREAKYNYELGEFSLIAHPKGNKRVTFVGYKSKNRGYFDTYPVALWSKQSEDEIKPLIDQLYPARERWEFTSDVGTNESLYEELDHKNLPDYQEIRKQHPDKMRSIVDIFLFKDLNESNKDEELEKAFQLIEFFREKGIQRFRLEISFYEERLLREKGRDIKVSGEYIDYLRHDIVLTHERAKKVRTPKDIEKYLVEYPK
ncbi:hypothetical protein CLV97_1193 [Planifilum fimeticola]|uniref:Uncharacterized protein n=1 Tax=Planifilum fimeticola TaxID=201975 RepID=A0A2T0LCS1_9BACL|nr:hypothetical protein [Planifilum fimeticola]PRX39845.1 hypothetical protein CLV97_1193 [Planifilum fimeticola]